MNTETGENFIKRIIKCSLSALFAIGVTSPSNIDKFVDHFTEELMKNYPVVPSEPANEPVSENTSPQDALQPPQKEEVDIVVGEKK